MKIEVKNITVILEEDKLLDVDYIHSVANSFECEECQAIFYNQILYNF